MSENPLFDQIKDRITSDPLISRYAVPGACRIWSDLAIKFIRQNYDEAEIKVEAREVVILDSLSHSFVHADINGEEFILDGSGIGLQSYFGPRGLSPDHFKNDSPDGLINSQL